MKITKEVMTEVFNRHYASLVYMATKVLQDSEMAKDMVSDCLEDVWNHRDRYTADVCKNILYKSVRNRCLDELRRRERLKYKNNEYAINIQTVDDSLLVQEINRAIVEADVLARIYNWMNSLPPQRREICKLSYIEGLDARQISKKMSISVSAITTQRHRMTTAVRKLLNRPKIK